MSYSGGVAPVGAGAIAAAAAAEGGGVATAAPGLAPDPEPMPVVEQRRVDAEHQVGRNDPCPCGSGKKYKKCHGA